MKETTLVQTLMKPRKPRNSYAGYKNPFNFGCGQRFGGLSEEAAKNISEIWEFDYMGAAEFEHGKIPDALYKIREYSNAGKSSVGKFNVTSSAAKTFFRPMKTEKPVKVPVYYICEQGTEKQVEKTAKQLNRNECKLYLSAPSGFKLAINSISFLDRYGKFYHDDEVAGAFLKDDIKSAEYHKNCGGWLELDNGFMFFVDKKMYEDSKKLFGIQK